MAKFKNIKIDVQETLGKLTYAGYIEKPVYKDGVLIPGQLTYTIVLNSEKQPEDTIKISGFLKPIVAPYQAEVKLIEPELTTTVVEKKIGNNVIATIQNGISAKDIEVIEGTGSGLAGKLVDTDKMKEPVKMNGLEKK